MVKRALPKEEVMTGKKSGMNSIPSCKYSPFRVRLNEEVSGGRDTVITSGGSNEMPSSG
jgi:hypothetical protein